MSDRLTAILARLAPREVMTSLGPVLVQPVRLENLVLGGTIPLPLLTKMMSMGSNPSKRSTEKALTEAKDALPGIKAVVFAAAVDPRISEETTEVSVGWAAFSQDDLALIVAEAIRPADELATFPATQEPGAGGVDAPDGGDLRGAAE